MAANDVVGGEIDGSAVIHEAIPNPCSVKDPWRLVGFLSLSLLLKL
jgi:hypothetical protein